MSTFKELESQLVVAKMKRAVLSHLVDYLESNFRPRAGEPPKRVLLTDDKIPVPDDMYEAVIIDLLNGISSMDQQIAAISGTTLAPSTQQPETPSTQGDTQ